MQEQQLSCTSIFVPVAMIAGAVVGWLNWGLIGALVGFPLGFFASVLLFLILFGLAMLGERFQKRD